MATLSSSGNWTGLSTSLAPILDTALPAPLTVNNLQGVDFVNPPDEIRQFLRLAQDGWGATVGAGKRLDFTATVLLVEKFLQAYKQQGLPRSGN